MNKIKGATCYSRDLQRLFEPMFSPLTLGKLELAHRVILAPLTRLRADPTTLAPTQLAVEYYHQRASKGGLLISEATLISPETFYEGAPGIWSADQVEGWKKVVDAVHSKGGLISCQLWHIGRVAHPSSNVHPLCKSSGLALASVSSSAIALKGRTREFGTKEKIPNAVPRALETGEIEGRLADDYARAARNARLAGFDSIEIHAAHGYLIDQFLNDGCNQRTDKFGGPISNRLRILDVVINACLREYPHDRIGIRLSPTNKTSMNYYQCTDATPELLYSSVVKHVDSFNLAYLLLSEPRWTGLHDGDPSKDPGIKMPLLNPKQFRPIYKGKIIGAAGFTPTTSKEAIDAGEYDGIAFGRWFIANPDLPERLKNGDNLNVYDRNTFYVGGPEGYIDYPSLDGAVGQKDKYRLMDPLSIGTSLRKAAL